MVFRGPCIGSPATESSPNLIVRNDLRRRRIFKIAIDSHLDRLRNRALHEYHRLAPWVVSRHTDQWTPSSRRCDSGLPLKYLSAKPIPHDPIAMYRPSEYAEIDRLNELKYEMRDGFVHVGLDRIVSIAKHLFKVPIALISLVESERQFFPARVGIEVTETSRASSFCAHALMSRALLIVPDSQADPRFANNPLVKDTPYIRFYAGCPLVSPAGFVLGTLCVIDTVARSGLSADDQRALRDLGALVEDQLELRRSTVEQSAQRAAPHPAR